jgi:hypothetical protein
LYFNHFKHAADVVKEGCGLVNCGLQIADFGLIEKDNKVSGCGVQVEPLKERFALGALRSRSVPSELEAFLPQAQRSSSETLIKRSAH